MWKSKIGDVGKNIRALAGYIGLKVTESEAENTEPNEVFGKLESDTAWTDNVRENEDTEGWKEEGKKLYHIAASLAEERGRGIRATGKSVGSGLSIKGRSAANTLGKSKSVQPGCLQGINARFWVAQGKGFCTYYQQDDPDSGYYLFLWSSALNERPAIRVNTVPFSEEQIRYHAPVFTSTDNGSTHLIAFAFIEPDTGIRMALRGGSVLEIKEYAVELTGHNSNAAISERNFRMKSAVDIKYQGPLGIIRDESGDIIVVGKAKGDRRVQVLNQGYFAWKFSNETLDLIVPRSIKRDDSGYLFCRWGGSQPTRPEHLVVWDIGDDALSLTYIGNYLVFAQEGYADIYKAHSASIGSFRSLYNTTAIFGTERCLVDTRMCNIDSTAAILSKDSVVEKVNNVILGELHCMFYIARAGRRNRSVLGVVTFDRGTYCVIENIAVIDFPALSLNVRSIGSSRAEVAVTERGKSNIHLYTVNVGDLSKLGTWDRRTLSVVARNYSGVDETEFIEAVYGENIESITDRQKSSRTRKETMILCGQLRGIPVSSRKGITVETISSDIAIEETGDEVSLDKVRSDEMKSDVKAVTENSLARATEHDIVIRSTSREVAKEQNVMRHTPGYGQADAAMYRRTTNKPYASGGKKHTPEKRQPGIHAGVSNAAGVDEKRAGQQQLAGGYRAQIEDSVGDAGLLNGLNAGAEDLYSPVSKKGAPRLEELRLCNSKDCASSNHESSGFNTVNINVSSFHNESWVNGSKIMEHPGNSTNGSTVPQITDELEPTEGFLDAVPPVLACAGLVFFAIAIALVSCTFLYIKWKTGSFILTRDYYDNMHDDTGRHRNEESHELVTPRGRSTRAVPSVALDEIDTSSPRAGHTYTSGL